MLMSVAPKTLRHALAVSAAVPSLSRPDRVWSAFVVASRAINILGA